MSGGRPTPLGQDECRFHEQNKREAFDAMRAYHQSEIAHKGHTVEVIKTLLTIVVTSYGGLVALILSREFAFAYALVAALALLLGVSLVVSYVVKRTNQKIKKDNEAYENHRSEYLAERSLLKINEALSEVHYKTHWQPRTGVPSGYYYTKRLIVALGWIVVVAAIFGTLLSVIASLQRWVGP